MTSSLTPFDKCVAVVIGDAINDKTQCWKLSDELIAILIGKPGSARRVRDSRNRLRAGGWLTWRRTNDANVYSLRYENVQEAIDEIMRQKRLKASYDVSNPADLALLSIAALHLADAETARSRVARTRATNSAVRLLKQLTRKPPKQPTLEEIMGR